MGQESDTLSVDTIAPKPALFDTMPLLNLNRDTMAVDSLLQDSLKTKSTSDKVSNGVNSNLGVKISKDGLDEIIDYGSTDSSFVDLKENQIHLFGNAFVKYQKYDLKAGYIIFDFDDNEASAFRLKDASGNLIQRPDFTDGTNKFKSNGLRFNFKTNKGLIYDAITNEGEFTIHGKKTKFVSKDADSTSVDDQIYNEHAIITTCDADHPHYGIRSTKLKVVPNKLAILGFSQLEIMGIPTPLVLPFGFFPLVQGRSNGLILPNNFEYDDNLGIGFREVGYYFPINEYMDLRVTGDIYTRGTHRINLRSNYKKRYKYNGNVELSYANNITESTLDGSRLSNRSYSLRVSHNQDPKAHPYITLGGTVNLVTNQFDQVNSTDVDAVVNNKINSSFSYRNSLPGTPFSVTAAFTHFQDTKTRKVNITLPDAQLRMQTLFPFKGDGSGKEGWYERISVGYNAKFKNYVATTDTTIFTSETLKNMQTGLSHKAETSFNSQVLKYINVSVNADFEQFVLTRRLEKDLIPDLIIDSIPDGEDQLGDTLWLRDTTFGMVNEFFENGLQTVELFKMNVSANTTLFATKRFKKGLIRGLRHTMKPSVGFSYSPDTELRYQDSVLRSSDPLLDDDFEFFNPYRNGAFSPSFNSNQMALTYGINSFFEGKYYSKADSTEKKFKLLNALNINGSYNFAADSIKFSPLTVSGNTSFFKGVTNINFGARYNYYVKNENGGLTKETVWSKTKRPVEFDNFNLTVTNTFTIGKIRQLFFPQKKNSKNSKQKKKKNKNGATLADWVDNFRIGHQFRYQIRRQNNGVDTGFVQSHSIKLSGSIKLTDNWNLSVRNIQYDLVDKEFVYPQFSLNRDLHCWTMQFSWSPAIEVYSFFIGVKSSSLSFLKYDYGKRNSGQLGGFR